MNRILIVVAGLLAVLLVTQNFGWAQNRTVTAADLAKALKECESDLTTASQQISSLRLALNETNQLIDKRKAVADSLIRNLKLQLSIQDSVTTLFRANSDTLQLMVRDYSTKLDEISKLYLHELSRQKQPWYLTKSGLQGLFNGLIMGGAAGLTYSLLKR